MKLFKSRDFLCILFVLFASWFAVQPLFHTGFFPMHDNTQITRVFVMSEALKDGQFPVRVVDFLGYGLGYPIFNFYAPLAYYIGAALTLFGISALTATKIMIGLGIILAGVFMYLLAKEFFGKIGGVVAALFYVYAPYHSVNVYVRGAIAELWAYAFIPLAVYGFYKLFEALRVTTSPKVPKIWVFISIASLGFAGIILSHNLSAMMVTPFLLLLFSIFSFQFLRTKQLFAVRFLLYAFILGLGLSAFYFLPALIEMKFTDVGSVLGGGSDFRDHFICPLQLWYSPWGYGGSEPGCVDGLSFQLGKPHIFFTFTSLFFLPFLAKKNKKKFYVLCFIFLCLATVIFLMLPQSQFIWEIASPMEYLQFPWRFLVLAAFFMSFLAGAVVYMVSTLGVLYLKRNSTSLILLLGSMLIMLLFYTKLFLPQNFNNNPQLQNEGKTIAYEVSKISDEYLPSDLVVPQDASEVPTERIMIIDGDATVKVRSLQSDQMIFTLDAKTPSTILIQKAAFPAWQLFLNGKRVTTQTEIGKITVSVSQGNYEGELVYISTPVQTIGNSVSIISALVLSAGIITSRKKKKRA